MALDMSMDLGALTAKLKEIKLALMPLAAIADSYDKSRVAIAHRKGMKIPITLNDCFNARRICDDIDRMLNKVGNDPL